MNSQCAQNHVAMTCRPRRKERAYRVMAGVLASAAGLVTISASSVEAAPERAVCAVQQAIACAPYEACERNLPGAVNLPVLLKIDRPANVVISRREDGGERTSKIGGEAGNEAMHMLSGIDDGNPWSIRVDLTTGHFTLTSAQAEVGYIAFGICSSKILD